MGKFKRFCMIVFVVAAVLGIGVLAALWFAWEPLFPAIAWLMSMPWFFVVEAVLLGITALGLLVVLIRAITAPGKNSQLELERDNGSIAITQNAIQSTVKHVGRCVGRTLRSLLLVVLLVRRRVSVRRFRLLLRRLRLLGRRLRSRGGRRVDAHGGLSHRRITYSTTWAGTGLVWC